jgi:hypothetical protein
MKTENVLKAAELCRKAQAQQQLSDKWMDALGLILPVFLTAGSVLDQFWADNHADWSQDVKAFISGHKIYLVDPEGTTIELGCISKEVAARPHSRPVLNIP